MLPSEFLLFSLFLLGYVLTSVHSAFTYEFGVPGSCDELEVSWTGGQGPFQLMLVPAFGTPRTFKIPDSSVTNGKGLYNVRVDFPVGQKIFLVMSDATGFGSGGTSLIIQVGPSVSGKSCNTTDPGVDFSFNLDSALTQCRTYVFSNYTQAVQPVTIAVFIPGGTAFQFNPPTGPSTYDWLAELKAGTSVVFAMMDSQGRNGGSSDIKLVGASDDTSCLKANSPASTSNPPTPTSSTSPSTTPSQNNSKNSGSSTIPITLGALGGVLALALTGAIIFFYFQRKRKREDAYPEGVYSYRGKRGSRRMSLDFEEPRPIDNTHDDQAVSHITPFSHSQGASSSDHLRHSREDFQDADLVPPRSGPPSSTGRSKASQAGSFRQPRYVVHTDVEDTIPEDGEQEVIELPPTYSERRGPEPPSVPGSSLYTDYQSPPPSQRPTAFQ
ncbi:hypothetical protein BDM02DRAFT_1539621 [Thelephora ganbajun]|uniref:Uncharacterized protein n=1 Tax=Thelephora ganbajun TaxID=370292 RepID=A0ACB6ZKG1_THEGA|nr:hypothetical protein BDM02DRAFT_1539621 [Thelephora ganbajun]